jgi:hypothetical protein
MKSEIMKDSNGDSNGDDDDVKRCVAAVQPDWPVTRGPKSELDIKNTPLPNPLIFQKISDSTCNEP